MNSRGIVLINVIMLLLVMVFVAGAMIQMSLSRSFMVARHRESMDGKSIISSVRTMLEACVAGQTFPPSTACPSPFGAWVNGGTCIDPATGSTLCNGGNETGTTAAWTPVSGGPTYTVSVCWCNPSGGSNPGRMILTCSGAAAAPCYGGCGC
jgi:hypothetical protein